jgi:hypothetical protein
MGKSKLSPDNDLLSTDKNGLPPANMFLSVAIMLLQVANTRLPVAI